MTGPPSRSSALKGGRALRVASQTDLGNAKRAQSCVVDVATLGPRVGMLVTARCDAAVPKGDESAGATWSAKQPFVYRATEGDDTDDVHSQRSNPWGNVVRQWRRDLMMCYRQETKAAVRLDQRSDLWGKVVCRCVSIWHSTLNVDPQRA